MARMDLNTTWGGGHGSTWSGSRNNRSMPRLTWRSDPVESLSDWTIEIVPQDRRYGNHKTTAKADSFHVHRCVLAASSSDFFRRLFFTTTQKNKQVPAVTRIGLEDCAKSAFPVLLDFLYAGEALDTRAVTSENALPLRYLAHFFGIPSLLEIVNGFIQEDLDVATAPLYYLPKAMLYSDAGVLQEAILVCANDFASLDEAAVMELPPDLFYSIITCPDLQGDCCSKLLSLRVTQYMLRHLHSKRHDDVFASSDVEDMVSSKIMVEIDPQVSCTLLDIATSQGLARHHYHSLRDRCVRSCSENWEDVLMRQEGSSLLTQMTPGKRGYSNLDNGVKVELLESSLRVAHKDLNRLRDAQIKVQSELDSLRHQVTSCKALQDELKTANQTSQTLRTEVWRLRSELAAAKQFESEAIRLQQQEQQNCGCIQTELRRLRPRLVELSKQFLAPR